MKKSLILLCVVVSIFLCLCFINFLGNRKSYVVFNDKSIIQISGKKYKFVDFKDRYLANKKFDVYDYNKYLGKYNIKFYDDRYKVFLKKEVVKFNSAFIGIYSKKNKVKLNTNSIEELNISEKLFLNRVLSDNNIQFNGNLTVNEKHSINGKDGYYLYNVSFDSAMGNTNDLFSIVYISNLEDYSIIESSFVDNSHYNELVSYNIDAVIDLDGDSNDEIVISDLMFSQSGNSLKKIYKLNGNKYILSK